MKRKIKPHKGGRTEQLHVRVTPEVKAFLDGLPVSTSDWIEQKVKEALEAQRKQENQATEKLQAELK